MTTTSTSLTTRQRIALRALLEEAAAEHREHYAHHTAILEELSEDTAGDAGVHDRDLALLAARRARDTIDDLQHALSRLDGGTYGTCESCGRTIPFERLEALPHARYCVACPRAGALLR